MENASKALLIAGAILIAILLIAIGMMVFNSASGVIDTASSGMTDHEKTMHNKKFNMYQGIQNGSQVKEVMKLAKDNNSNSENYPIDQVVVFAKINGKVDETWDYGALTYSDTKTFSEGIDWVLAKGWYTPLGNYEVKCKDKSQKKGSTEDGLISRIEIWCK